MATGKEMEVTFWIRGPGEVGWSESPGDEHAVSSPHWYFIFKPAFHVGSTDCTGACSLLTDLLPSFLPPHFGDKFSYVAVAKQKLTM